MVQFYISCPFVVLFEVDSLDAITKYFIIHRLWELSLHKKATIHQVTDIFRSG